MQLNRYLDWSVKIGLYLILFAPLVVSTNMFFPFITGKNFLFRMLVEIIFAAWLILVLRDRSYLPSRSLILIFVAASTLVLTLATAFGVDPSRSFWSNFERMEGLLGHLHLLAFFLVLIGVNRTEKDWWRFFHISILASIFVSGYAFLQLAGKLAIHQGGVRLDATLGNATYLAVYLLFHLFILLYYFLRTSSLAWRIFYSALFILEAFLLYATATRGAILGFIGGLFLFALLFGLISKERRFRFFSYGIIGLIVLSILGFYLIRDSQFVRENPTLARLRNISLEDDTTKARFYVWQMSWEGFKERPILGWGPENFNVLFAKHFDPRLWKQEPWFDRAHNAVFDWLTAAGIFGLIVYLGILFSTVFILFRAAKQGKVTGAETSVFIGLLAAYYFQNLFVFDQLTSYILFFSILAYIHFRSGGPEIALRSSPAIQPGKANVFGAVSLVVLIFILYFFNIKPLLANFSLLEALELANGGKFGEAQAAFKKTLNFKTIGLLEAREQYAHFASLIVGRNDIPETIRLSAINDSISEMKEQIASSPLDPRPYLFLGSVYNSVGQPKEALRAFEKALELSPNKQQIIFLVAHTYFSAGNAGKALELAERGAKLDPTYSDAQHDFINLLIRAGRDEPALENIKKLVAGGRADHKSLKSWASVYAGEKKYNIAIQIYQEALKMVPADTQARISLAASYYETGRANLAIAEIKRAIELDPAFKEQGEIFIRELQSGRRPE